MGSTLSRRVSVTVFSTAVLLGLAQPALAAKPVSVPDHAVDEVTAQKFAKLGNKDVLVTSRTSETAEVTAKPDGSLTLKQFTKPVRVKRGDGWVDVDVTLAKRADGSIGPKASTVDVTLSPGGDKWPLVKVGSGDAEVGLGWESALPAPKLDGATALYEEVWPGVDLKVTADTTGFSEVLVVKTAEAAKSPKLAKVNFGSYTKNTKVDDKLAVTGKSGEVLFQGNATRMWDSAGHRAEMTAEVTASTVAVKPDAAFLAAADTRFPVFIDPEYYCSNTSWCGKQHHVVTQSGHATAHNFDATDGDLGDLKAGYENYDSAGTSHSYIAMNTEPINGKIIHWARLDAPVLHTASCSPAGTELWHVGGIDWNTTWNSQPGYTTFLGNSNVANCRDAGGVTSSWDATGPVKDASRFNWGTTTFGLKGTDDDESHNRVASWRRFGLNPYLEVNYDSVPNNPWAHYMQQGAVPCAKGDGRPWIDTKTPQVQAAVSDPDGGNLSVLVATSGGPYGHDVPNTYHDNNSNRPTVGTPGPNQAATAQYFIPAGWIGGDGIYKWAMRVSDGEADSPRWDWDCEFYVDTAVPLAPSVALTGTKPELQGDQASFSIAVGLATADLDDIDRFVYTTDGSDPSVQGSPSVKRNAGLTDGKVTATLNATAANGNQNIIRIKAVNRTGKPGPNAICTAGNGLDAPSCSYSVLPLTPEKGLMGSWGIDDTWGTSTTDNVAALRPGATAHPATLNGDAAWWLGYSKGNGWTQPDTGNNKEGTKGGMRFNGAGFLSTAGPVLDTTKSFTLSAWAKPTEANVNTYHAVIGQDGGTNSGAFIEYSSDANAWTFNLPATDTTSPDNPRIAAKAPPQLNVWQHLVGTYDAVSGVATLYVDGVRQNSLVRKGYASNGPLTIGALKWSGARNSHFVGFIDDAQVWQRALSPEDVRSLATASVSRARFGLGEGAATLLATGSTGSQDTGNFVPAPVPSLQGYWKLDDTAGTTSADAGNHDNGYAPRPLTLSGDAAWAPGKTGNGVHFGGTGYGTTSGSVVDTSRSFTVSAWAKTDDLAGYYGVIGQKDPTTNAPSFLLRYSPDVKAWIFGVNSDSSKQDGPMNWAYQSDSVTKAGEWTLVTGVFNTETKQILMYVNGKLTGRSTYEGTPWNATGPLTIGAYVTGGLTHQFKGSIDQVQVWQQALTPSQIAGMAGLSYQDDVWNLNGSPAVATAGNIAEVATKPDSVSAQVTWDGTATAGHPDAFRTDRSYTAEAWVRADVTDGPRSAVSFDDTAVGPFSVGMRDTEAGEVKWVFYTSCGTTATCVNFTWSDAKAEKSRWTHLAAVYDSVNRTACLYVNGVKQSACTTNVSSPASAGEFRLGKFRWNNALADPWHGGIAGVRLYSGVRTSEQIKGDRTAEDPGKLFGTVH